MFHDLKPTTCVQQSYYEAITRRMRLIDDIDLCWKSSSWGGGVEGLTGQHTFRRKEIKCSARLILPGTASLSISSGSAGLPSILLAILFSSSPCLWVANPDTSRLYSSLRRRWSLALNKYISYLVQHQNALKWIDGWT